MGCMCCTKPETKLLTTAYGEMLCEDCWFDYLFTDQGMIEHFIWLVTGKALVSWYDADFLGGVLKSWQENKERLNLDKEVIEEFDEVAFHLFYKY